MDNSSKKNQLLPPSFYDNLTLEDENVQATIKPILNQILENRVVIKELHTQFAVRFSEMIISYQNRLEDIKGSYEEMIKAINERENSILTMCNEIHESLPEK